MKNVYFDEEKCGDGRQFFQFRIVERVGRMVGQLWRDPEDVLGWSGWPIGRRERETVVSSGVHWTDLKFLKQN